MKIQSPRNAYDAYGLMYETVKFLIANSTGYGSAIEIDVYGKESPDGEEIMEQLQLCIDVIEGRIK